MPHPWALAHLLAEQRTRWADYRRELDGARVALDAGDAEALDDRLTAAGVVHRALEAAALPIAFALREAGGPAAIRSSDTATHEALAGCRDEAAAAVADATALAARIAARRDAVAAELAAVARAGHLAPEPALVDRHA